MPWLDLVKLDQLTESRGHKKSIVFGHLLMFLMVCFKTDSSLGNSKFKSKSSFKFF